MGRSFAILGGFLVGIALTIESAQAGDRKSIDRVHQAATNEIAMSRAASFVSFQRAQAVRPFEAQVSTRAEKRAVYDEKAMDSGVRAKPLTLFNIRSRLGNIGVQPVIGPVQGAQFAVEF